MICKICDDYWTPSVGWYLLHPEGIQNPICASCLEKQRNQMKEGSR